MSTWRPRTIGRPGEPAYLWRLNLIRAFGFTIKLHRFLNSDADPCLHDHPWPFASLILTGGYYEVSESGATWMPPGTLLQRPATWRHRVIIWERACGHCGWCGTEGKVSGDRLLQVPVAGAAGRHHQCMRARKVIPLTLFFTGLRCRRWGFWTSEGWVPWREFEEC